MNVCPKCHASMEYIFTLQGSYWICRTCGYVPTVTYSNKTEIRGDI